MANQDDSSTSTNPQEKPILFSAPMVRAILEGRKTQTRRLLSPQPAEHHWQLMPGYQRLVTVMPDQKGLCARISHHYLGREDDVQWVKCPYGKLGDRLWVREAISKPFLLDVKSQDFTGFYRATEPERKVQWTPSIHMPRWASRITLEITGVRVERLQEISEADAEKEGCERMWPMGNGYYGDSNDSENPSPMHTYRGGFRYLWDHINGKRASWESNPWVWVVSFKRLEDK